MARTRRESQWTPADKAGYVLVDLPCANCGHSLRGELADGGCPECGYAVESSTRKFLLRDAPPGWVSDLEGAVTLLALLLIPAYVLFHIRILSLAKFAVPGEETGWGTWCCGSFLIVGVVLALGMLAVGGPSKPRRRHAEGFSARRAILHSLWALPAAWLCAEAFRFVSPNTVGYGVVVFLFSVAQVFCWVVLPFAVLRRLSNLLYRVPALLLAGSAKVLAYLFAADGLVTTAALILWRFPLATQPQTTMPTSEAAAYRPNLGYLTELVDQILLGGPVLGVILGALGIGLLLLARGYFRDAARQARRSKAGG